MKKLLLILLCLPLLFSTCKKEDEVTPTNSGNNNTGNNTSSIIGKWNATYYTYDYYETSNLDTEHWVGTDDIDYWNEGHFWHIEFLTGDELQITTNAGSTSSGQDSLYTRNISYYTNGDDFYLLEEEWVFGFHGTGVPNKILLLDNTNLTFSVPWGWSENGGYGEQVIHCVRIQ